MKTILLKMAGPLQAWGTQSHFETRHTDFYPSKSAIIGLVAASLGYQRDSDEQIKKLNELNFAVRIDQQGKLLRDYHTARKYKENGQFERTYVTNRYYLEDAIFVVAIGHENEAWINKIEYALKNPYYQTFMGKRALPLQADFFLGSYQKSVIEALREIPWLGKLNRNDTEMLLPIYADTKLLCDNSSTMRKDLVLSFSQKNRKFGYRGESKIQVTVKDASKATEHDAFGAIGG